MPPAGTWDQLDVGTATHVGARPDNQDVVATGASWAVVADGIGGYAGGRQAAEITTAKAGGALQRAATVDEVVCRDAIRAANAAVREGQRLNGALQEMGSTVTLAAAVSADEASSTWLVANVGDSPGWAIEGGTIRLVTVEHSMAAELVALGVISPSQARTHPGRHVVTRAIGLDGAVEPAITPVTLAAGDALVLASDGIEVIQAGEILRLVGEAASAADAAERLVTRARHAGATDNITVAVVVHR